MISYRINVKIILLRILKLVCMLAILYNVLLAVEKTAKYKPFV